MPDYSLGRAHGQIQISYDGSGAGKAARDLDQVAKSSEDADKSLSKTQKTLGDTEKQFDETGSSADGYSRRLKEVESASRDVDAAEQNLKKTLLDEKASLDDVKDAHDRVSESKKRHTQATNAERDAHRALSDEMGVGRRALSALSSLVPDLSDNFTRLSNVTDEVTDKSSGLARGLSGLSKVVALLGPEAEPVAIGLKLLGNNIDDVGGKASDASGFISTFVKDVASFEVGFGKVAGLTLGATSIGGLGGLVGAGALQGVVELADAVKQLSGVLGLVPAVVSGVGFSMETLKVAFHGVDDALKDMMADDPKKFLDDIKNMGPLAAESMLQVAQFRDAFKMAGAAVQDSFFAQIAKDIAPLIQTWLPAITAGMSQVAGVFGEAADQLAKLLTQPAAVNAFTAFVNNVSAGLKALEPAIAPLVNIFSKLTVVGSSFFQQIGGEITKFLNFFAQIVNEAAASGKLQAWIQDGINAFERLVDIAYEFGSAFLNIMDVAEKFGGGGFLGWLQELAKQFNAWTQSAAGQKALTNFFTTLSKATDALMPMLGPLLDGLASIGSAFAQLGIGTAPGWQKVFDTFAQTMAYLGPQIAATAPAINTFLTGLASAFAQLMASVGPQLPQIFQLLADAFVALLPQLGPLVDIFIQLIETLLPRLPAMFSNVTTVIQELMPYMPLLMDLFNKFLTVVDFVIFSVGELSKAFTNFFNWLKGIGGDITGALSGAWDHIKNFFTDLAHDALQWGKDVIHSFAQGLSDATGLTWLKNQLSVVPDAVRDKLKTSSPAKEGPLHEDSPNEMGEKVVRNFAAGMAAARPAVAAAAAGTAGAVASGLTGAGGGGGGGAPSPGGSGTVGSALLPDNIAGADTSILTAYLRHQFSDTRGLKGLAKSLGGMLDIAKGGFDLINQHAVQPMFQALGMLPGAKDQGWRKLSPKEIAAQQQSDAEKKSLQQGPQWSDVLGGPPASSGAQPTPTAGATVPLVQNPDGTWTSPNAAWAHLINRESGGINQRQKIIDVNSGGNEAEGLFQITPGTWKAHGGTDFATNPLAATPQQQALIAARILQKNPSGSDWGAGRSGRESAQELLGGLLGAPPPGAKSGPTWSQVTGTPPAAATPTVPGDWWGGGRSLPPGTAQATGAVAAGLPDAHGAHAQIAMVEQIAARFGLKLTAGKDDHQADGGYHPRGMAGDFSNAQANSPQMLAFAKYMADNFGPLVQELIYSDPNFKQLIGGGKNVTGTGYYSTGVLAEHANHVHVAIKDELAGAFQQALSGAPQPLELPNGAGFGAGAGYAPPANTGAFTQTFFQGNGVILPSGKSLDSLTDTSQKNLSVDDKLLQAYLQGNPALAQQIDAAKTPGAADDTVLGTLGSISKTIDTLKTQDAVGNKNTIDALQNQQSQIAQQQGFASGPNTLQQAQSIAGGISGAITGVFQSISSGLDALAATQDIADRLVYGVRNTEDINKIIDDAQKWITYAANVISTIGSIVSTAGSFTGGADFGGTSAAGSALSLIAGVLQGVNAAIDFGQQVYEITMGYVGRFMSFLTAGVGGTALMGNVSFLLNKNTGQLQSYSMDNPELKNTANVPSFLKGLYGYGNSNPNPQVNQQLNVYAGPGQSPAEMMNETMWMVNTQGTSGALAPANF